MANHVSTNTIINNNYQMRISTSTCNTFKKLCLMSLVSSTIINKSSFSPYRLKLKELLSLSLLSHVLSLSSFMNAFLRGFSGYILPLFHLCIINRYVCLWLYISSREVIYLYLTWRKYFDIAKSNAFCRKIQSITWFLERRIYGALQAYGSVKPVSTPKTYYSDYHFYHSIPLLE